jgi:hypothetical protein
VSTLTVDGFRCWRPDVLLGGGVFDMRVRLAVFMGPERLQYYFELKMVLMLFRTQRSTTPERFPHSLTSVRTF